MHDAIDKVFALSQAIIELARTTGPFALAGASLLFLAFIEYLTRPLAAYLAFPSYGEREFALLVVNMDAAPLGKKLSFPVHAERVTRVRAFPCHERSPKIEVNTEQAGNIDITINHMAEEDTVMLVFEHTQPRALASFRVGKPKRGAEYVVPRHWRSLPDLTLPRRMGRAVVRIIPGIIVFVVTYATLRGGFTYPLDVNRLNYSPPMWDTAIITIGVIGCAVAYWMSSMDKGRQLAIPSEAHGVSWRSAPLTFDASAPVPVRLPDAPP